MDGAQPAGRLTNLPCTKTNLRGQSPMINQRLIDLTGPFCQVNFFYFT